MLSRLGNFFRGISLGGESDNVNWKDLNPENRGKTVLQLAPHLNPWARIAPVKFCSEEIQTLSLSPEWA